VTVAYFLLTIFMKKQDFIKAVAASSSLTIDTVGKSLTAFIDIITKEIQNGGEVNITGFGVFKSSMRAKRNGVNPKTREAITIPAMKSPVFRA
jgi:DNA-binding protein HU-beta